MSLAFGECMPVRLTWKVLESYENNGRVDGERVGLVPRSSNSTRRLQVLQVLLWSIKRSNR